jgi:hypothetical protein
MRRGVRGFKEWEKVVSKRLFYNLFVARVRKRIDKINNNYFIVKHFSKALAKQYAFSKFKEILLIRHNDNHVYDKYKRVKIEVMMRLHLDFFNILRKRIDISHINEMQYSYFRKKIYLNFFKKVCRCIALRNNELKKLQDVDEIYNFNTIAKYFKRLQYATEASIEERSYSMKRYFLLKKTFIGLKSMFVNIPNLV